MFRRVQTWLAERRRKEAALQHAIVQALAEFRRTREVSTIGAHVLRMDANETIVRIMFMTTHVPPERAWFAVSADGVRELAFDDVAHLESPWR